MCLFRLYAACAAFVSLAPGFNPVKTLLVYNAFMTEITAMTHEPDDFSDLGFDITPHREALTSFARLNLELVSIRPALRARDLVFVRVPACRFAIGLTDDPVRQEASEVSRGCLGFVVIYEAESAAQAALVRHDVERYFLRHYPGRTMAWPNQTVPAEGVYVYITCYAPLD